MLDKALRSLGSRAGTSTEQVPDKSPSASEVSSEFEDEEDYGRSSPESEESTDKIPVK